MAVEQLSITKASKEIERDNDIAYLKSELAKTKDNILTVSKQMLKDKGVL